MSESKLNGSKMGIKNGWPMAGTGKGGGEEGGNITH